MSRRRQRPSRQGGSCRRSRTAGQCSRSVELLDGGVLHVGEEPVVDGVARRWRDPSLAALPS